MNGRVSLIVASFVAGATLLIGWISVSGVARPLESEARIFISEVAWQGTAANFHHEWMELYNPSPNPRNIQDWTLTDGGDIQITLTGTLPAYGYYLLERTEESISDINANQLYLGVLSDSGESLILRDNDQQQIDSVNGDGGNWPAGTGSPTYRSMERRTSSGESGEDSWVNNDTKTRNGLDANFSAINGTPGKPNSSWSPDLISPDLAIGMKAPITANTGDNIRYTLTVSNLGDIDATQVELMNVLPEGFVFSDDSGLFPRQQPEPGTIIWQLGTIPTRTLISLQLTATINYGYSGPADNYASVSTVISETNLTNNQAQASTEVIPTTGARVLIKALHFSGYEDLQSDEAVRLMNVGGSTVDLSGWKISDNEGEVTFPETATLQPGEQIWLARNASSFSRQFGFEPDFEIDDSNPGVPDLIGSGPRFADYGDEVLLIDSNDLLHDAMVYLSGNSAQSGWVGPTVEPYALQGIFGSGGQILYRLSDQSTGWPNIDTNTAEDWAQTTGNHLIGKRVQYPGWDLDMFFFSQGYSEMADVTIGIAPDNALDLFLQEINGATKSLEIESLTFRSWPVALEIISAANRGVQVTILLEGDPPGGIDDQEKYICQQVAQAGGNCWFMISNADKHIYDRYRYLHAKYIVVDQERVIISTENLSPDSLPNDPKGDGTWGRRGLVVATNSPGIVEEIKALWQSDFDPLNHADLVKWQSDDPKYGDPPPGTIPVTETGGSEYQVRYPSPWHRTDLFTMEVTSAPENSLRNQDGILHLIGMASLGDSILVQQLNERPHWGPSSSNRLADPNPRLEALVNAARRGASVRLLLDEYFEQENDIVGNRVTCQWVNETATSEQLDLNCSLANPTGLGIHNKMILIQLNGSGYSFIGSINGTELSHKGNREVALLIQSDELYRYLAQMFHTDWPHEIYLPFFPIQYIAPADHILISEILYDPPGSTEDDEFVELVNPTQRLIRLDNFSLADASKREDFEDSRYFPADTIIQPAETLVIATTATGFRDSFGTNPDFEILETDSSVPNLIDNPGWGDPAAILRLGNSGDEVYLRDPTGKIVDAVAYGVGKIPGQLSCPLVAASGRSLERFPFWRDTDDCPFDFRDWPLPNPGSLP